MVSNGLKSGILFCMKETWNLVKQKKMPMVGKQAILWLTFTHPLPSTFTLLRSLIFHMSESQQGL